MNTASTALQSNQKQSVSVAPTCADGTPAVVDGPPVFSSSDPTVARVDPIPNTGYFELTAVGPGNCTITVTEAQHGTPTTGTISVSVTLAAITDLNIVLGTPVSQLS